MFGIKHSLHRKFKDAKPFYASYTALFVAAAASCSSPARRSGLITKAVQALAGVLLPSASVFLLLLCNDRDVLGPWVNPPLAQRPGQLHHRRARRAVRHARDYDLVLRSERGRRPRSG